MNTASQHYLDGFLAGTGEPPGVKAGEPSPATALAAPARVEEPAVDLPPPVDAQPQNWEEEVKRTLSPWDAFPRVLECAASDQPPTLEDAFRFRWFGLWYQGPAMDAFIVRLRLPGGSLQAFQMRGLAEIAQELASGAVNLNAQGGLDLPGIPVRDCAEVLRRVEAIGLTARGSGGDCVQAVGGDAASAGAAGSGWVIELGRTLEQALAMNREFGELPGPCEIIFSAAPVELATAAVPATSPDGAEAIVLAAALSQGTPNATPEGWFAQEIPPRPCWDVLLPGGGSLGVALPASEILPACLALLRVWSRQADRSTRERAALRNFCAELGLPSFRRALESELGRKLASPLEQVQSTEPAGTPTSTLWPFERLLSGQLLALERWLAAAGISEVRLVRGGGLLLPPGADVSAFAAAMNA